MGEGWKTEKLHTAIALKQLNIRGNIGGKLNKLIFLS